MQEVKLMRDSLFRMLGLFRMPGAAMTLVIAAPIALAADPAIDAAPSDAESAAQAPLSAGTGSVASSEQAEPLTGHELLRATREALRRWAQPEDDELTAAAREMLPLYRALDEDRELAVSRRSSLQHKLAVRLGDLARRIRARSPNAAKDEQSTGVAAQPARVRGEEPLAQRGFGGFGQPGFGQGGFGQPGFGQGGGPFGPQPPFGGGRGAGGQFGAQGGNFLGQDDNGDELVDLIETTIYPQTWQRNGGPGAIYYWRNQRAIIVRQRGDVHDRVGDLLQQLQRAGR